MEKQQINASLHSSYHADGDKYVLSSVIKASNLPQKHEFEKRMRKRTISKADPSVVKKSVESKKPSNEVIKSMDGPWTFRYKQLLLFYKDHGHTAVPYKYEKNQHLARWAKRQRMQYKYWVDGNPTKLTEEKIYLLEAVGFVWNLHEVNWRQKLAELVEFRKKYNHCNVPKSYKNQKLSVWVKCQRRQYNLFWDGRKSAMTPERIVALEKVGFEWGVATLRDDRSEEEHIH